MKIEGKNPVKELLNGDHTIEKIIIADGTNDSEVRILQKKARDKGIKVGLLRPITLFPFPTQPIKALAQRVKGILTVEMSAGQMVYDVKLASEFKCPVEYFGRYGGIIPTPQEVVEALENKLIKG